MKECMHMTLKQEQFGGVIRVKLSRHTSWEKYVWWVNEGCLNTNHFGGRIQI